MARLRQFCNIDEESVGTSQVVKGVVARMEDEVRDKPYLLVAYAFTLYLAVLSGGRHIRSELCKAGVDFWTGIDKAEAEAVPEKKAAWNWMSPVPSLGRLNPYAKKPTTEALSLDEAPRSRKPLPASEIAHFENLGLSFWFFPGSADGEDLRVKFKANLEELSQYISPSQEDEIIAEAQAIFSRIEALVGELDVAVATGTALGEPVKAAVDKRESSTLNGPPAELKVEDLLPQTVTIGLPVSQNEHLAPFPWWAGLAMVMCGVSYAAVVYSKTWP
jgi:heme oxygenase